VIFLRTPLERLHSRIVVLRVPFVIRATRRGVRVGGGATGGWGHVRETPEMTFVRFAWPGSHPAGQPDVRPVQGIHSCERASGGIGR
jgi:hypothetical protein